MDIAKFYDLRGRFALDTAGLKIPDWAVTPYDFAQSLVTQLEKHEGATCLDLCCGTGLHSDMLARAGYKVFGVDISELSVKAARAKIAEDPFSSRYVFECTDAESYLSMGYKFDLIFISGSLYYLDRAKILPLISAALKPGGVFIAVETNGSNALMNLIRKLRFQVKHDRDLNTLGGLIRTPEVSTWGNYFTSHEVHFFDFFTMAGALLSFSKPLQRQYLRVAKSIDRLVLKNRLTSWLAFKFVFVAKMKP